jgi:hypothetical protein
MLYDGNEILRFYIQFLKMNKERLIINSTALFHKYYTNVEITVQKNI